MLCCWGTTVSLWLYWSAPDLVVCYPELFFWLKGAVLKIASGIAQRLGSPVALNPVSWSCSEPGAELPTEERCSAWPGTQACSSGSGAPAAQPALGPADGRGTARAVPSAGARAAHGCTVMFMWCCCTCVCCERDFCEPTKVRRLWGITGTVVAVMFGCFIWISSGTWPHFVHQPWKHCVFPQGTAVEFQWLFF